MDANKIQNLMCCPQTHQDLSWLSEVELQALNQKLNSNPPLEAAVKTLDGKCFYPIKNGIPVLLPEEAIIIS